MTPTRPVPGDAPTAGSPAAALAPGPRWVCVHCHTPVNGTRFDPWCPTCQDKTIAEQASPLTYEQYRAICDLFTSIGEINRGRRLRWLGDAIGRRIRDYGELTEREATTAQAQLEERVNGHRT